MIDFFIIFFATYAGYLLMGGLVVFLLKDCLPSGDVPKGQRKRTSLILQMVAAAVLSRGIITEAIRLFWHRARPFVEQNFIPLIPHADSASFPSGHATFFFAIGTVLYMYNKKAGMVFLLGSAVIGIARIFAGVHWPSDVIGGALIGIFSGWFVFYLLKLKVNKKVNKQLVD